MRMEHLEVPAWTFSWNPGIATWSWVGNQGVES